MRSLPLAAWTGALTVAGLLLACDRPPASSASSNPRLAAALKERAQQLDARETNVGTLVPDLAYSDLDGRSGRLSDFRGRPLVLAVRDVGCPVSQRTAPVLARLEDEYRARDVAFLFLNESPHNTPEEIRADIAAHGFDGPTIHDAEQRLGAALGALTTTEVFVLDGARTLVYRGAIDDQVGRGTLAAETHQHYLRDALEQTLVQQKVLVPATSAPGCLLGIEASALTTSAPTYHREVARILQQNCVECHRVGGVGPFALENYAQARGRRAMLELVTEDGIMPPWFAAPDTGPWANDRRLSERDKQTLLSWIEADAPEGDPAETPLAIVYPDGWRIGEPDLVFQMQERFEVPAEGVVRTRFFEVTPEVPADLWIQRLEIRPEARAVVHHVTVSYQLPVDGGDSAERELRRALLPWSRSANEGWVFLFGYLPGKGPRAYPEGIARFLPAGAKLRFDMHYTPNGKAIFDQTSLGLVLADGPPELVAESRNFWNVDIVIPPLAPSVTFTKEYPLNHDVLLRSLTPHMHLRGKSMVADLIHPDGQVEKLIDIPAWDQNWQFNYVFRTPRVAQAGSRVRVTATYDNSPDNPANPDPNAWVKDGPQTTDEMMSLIVEWIRPRVSE
ncbi:MAG: redoxin domain-containing protein [Planctomycetes bacterium]|nr:redoxin domain-containing protein [Planctomycetota bacterium]